MLISKYEMISLVLFMVVLGVILSSIIRLIREDIDITLANIVYLLVVTPKRYIKVKNWDIAVDKVVEDLKKTNKNLD